MEGARGGEDMAEVAGGRGKEMSQRAGVHSG